MENLEKLRIPVNLSGPDVERLLSLRSKFEIELKRPITITEAIRLAIRKLSSD